jgi:tetratricopeptide (TPR) repeat protein
MLTKSSILLADASPLSQRLKRPSRLAFLAVLGVLFLCGAQQAAVGGEDDRFFSGLRQRRLFELARKYCELRWADKTLTSLERGEVAVEWIRALADQARHSSASDRSELVQLAHEVAARFQSAHPGHSMGFLVRTQEAIADANLGELLRLEAEVAAEGAAGREEARKLSRSAARDLEQIDRELAEYLPQRFRKTAASDELTVEQLAALQHQVRLQAARTQRNLALAYDDGSDDRLAVLGRGLQLLEPSLRQLTPEMPLHAPVHLEQVAQLRLLGKLDAARQALSRLDPSTLDAETTLAIRTEALRIALGQGDSRGVSRLLELGGRGEVSGVAAAEWDFARLEVVLARWRDAVARSNDLMSIQDEAFQLLDVIERDHGPYWKHRGDLQLVRLGAAVETRNPDLLARTADSLLKQGRPDEALAALDQSIAQAQSARRASDVFALALKAGMIEQRRSRFAEAARRLQQAAIESPREQRAAETHLAAVWNLAQQLREETKSKSSDSSADVESSREISERYVAWLNEHLRLWPSSATCNQVWIWLAAWYEAHRNWEAAMGAYRQVAVDSSWGGEAWRGVVRNEKSWWFSSPEAPQPAGGANAVKQRESRAREVLDWFKKFPPADKTTPEDRELVAGLRMQAALVLPGEEDTLRQSLAESQTLPVEVMTGLLLTMRESLRSAASSRKMLLGGIAGELSKKFQSRRNDLPEVGRRALDGLLAESLAATGKRQEAVAAYRELATAAPQDGATQQALAELLEAGSSKEDWQAALDQWRRVAAKSPPRTTLWYRSKLGVATMLVRLGKQDEADKFIRFLEITPPGIPEPWRAEFERLKK